MQRPYIQVSILKKVYDDLKRLNKKREKMYILMTRIIEDYLKKQKGE